MRFVSLFVSDFSRLYIGLLHCVRVSKKRHALVTIISSNLNYRFSNFQQKYITLPTTRKILYVATQCREICSNLLHFFILNCIPIKNSDQIHGSTLMSLHLKRLSRFQTQNQVIITRLTVSSVWALRDLPLSVNLQLSLCQCR